MKVNFNHALVREEDVDIGTSVRLSAVTQFSAEAVILTNLPHFADIAADNTLLGLRGAVQGLSDRDFERAGLNVMTASTYSRFLASEKRIKALKTSFEAPVPAGAYITSVIQDQSDVQTIIGMTAFARDEGSVASNTLASKMLERLKLVDRDTKQRLFTSWFNAKKLPEVTTAAEIADRIMRLGIEVARQAGLSELKIMQGDVAQTESGLSVVEHMIEPARYGFVEIDEQSEVKVEKKTYRGHAAYVLQLAA
jgi:hypothetical protein